MEQQWSLTQQEKALSLFSFIRELNKLKQKVIRNWREYPFCRPLSGLPEDPEHVRIFYRDRVEEDVPEAAYGNVLLSVRKPTLEPCPKPGTVLEEWLIEGWENHHNESQTHACRSRKSVGQSGGPEELEWFDEDQLLIVQGAEDTQSFVLLHSFFFIINLRLTLFTLGMTDASIVLLSLTHKVRIVHFEEPSTGSLLVLLHLLFGMRPHVLMHLDVAGDAQQLAVVRVVCQSLHLLHGLGLLHRLDVVHVHAWRDDALL